MNEIRIAAHSVETLRTHETNTTLVLSPNGTGGVQWVAGGGGGGGGGAPTDAEYIVGAAHAGLSNERVVSNSTTVGWNLTTPGVASAYVVDGGITTVKIADGAVTTAKIADGAVTGAKIATGAVGSTHIANGAVGSTHIANGAVNSSHIADGSVATVDLADGAVTTAKIANTAVIGTKIAAGAVGSTHIADGAIGSIHIADGAVTGTKIADGAVTGTKIATGAVGSTHIANGAVNSSHIADGSVATADLADGAVTTAKIAAGAVILNRIQDLTAGRLMGRTDASAGPPQEIAPASGLFVSGTALRVRRTLNFLIDGGGSAITTGSKGYVFVTFPATIVGWTILADQTGNIVVDVRKATYTNFPTTSSIAGTEKPTLSSAQKNQDTALSSWTTALSPDDVLEFFVESAATVTRVTVALHLE